MRNLTDILEILFVINVKNTGQTKKKQCDRHNKNVKCISKLEFEKDIINELREVFNVKQKEIDQIKKKELLKSTNPLN